MRRHRVGWIASILLALGVSGVSARASETPVYLVTGGTATLNQFGVVFAFSGPGFSLSGGTESPCCLVFSVGVTAESVDGRLTIEAPDVAFGTVGGQPFGFAIGEVDITGSAALPNPPITIPEGSFFPVSGPASFSGSFIPCRTSFTCGPDQLATIVFNNTGIATFDLSGPFGTTEGREYEVTEETFTVTPTPEPATWLMYATGLLMISLVLLRKH